MLVSLLLGSCVELLTSDSNVLMGIYFQDEEMRQVFSAYPELICIDATYKLLELRFPVYVMLAEDGNGLSEIVAVFLLLEETEHSVKRMISIFKKYNPQWQATHVLMADKDMVEREVMAAEFPSAKLLICLFHTFRSFRCEVAVDKMGITSGQRSMCLEILQQMAYATSEDSYDDLYVRFCSCAPSTVVKYFDTQWHPIRDQWVMGMKYKAGNFLNSTNNRLESLNQKLKSVISRYSSLEEFVDKFFLILRVLRSERDHKAALVAQKVPVAFHSCFSNDDLLNYMNFLTPYAYRFVAKQMELKEKIQPQQKEDDIDLYEVMSSEGLLTVTKSSCQCTLWLSMKLPCRHIFATRSLLNIPLYDEFLCCQRWTADYYKLNQRIFTSVNTGPDDSAVEVTCLPSRKKHVLSQVYNSNNI